MWQLLFDLVVLLTAAMVLGAIAERLKQSALLGYLLAGTLLGPNTLGLIGQQTEVEVLAELGVALLLFTIGLEFSWRRLRRTGKAGLGGGSLQIVITLLLVAGAAWLFKLDARSALAVGAMLALSSTATVLRVLVARANLDSVHGRTTLGILLVQDIAVVPLVLMVSVMNEGGSAGEITWAVGKALGAAGLLIGSLYVLLNFIVPGLLNIGTMRGYRELPILLAIVVGFGSAIAAHRLGLSPALGTFVAGMLMAESPFATQIRADISSLRTLLITLFFSSIGMLGDPAWALEYWLAISLLVVAIVVGKTSIIWFVLRRFGQTHRHALTAGLCLAQVGEFSFVLAGIAKLSVTADGKSTGFLDDDLFKLVISATIVTLFLTPYLVTFAPRIANRLIERLERLRFVKSITDEEDPANAPLSDHIIIVGFGPSGSAVGVSLVEHSDRVVVVDLNPKLVRAAQRFGFRAHIGDARHGEILEHLSLPLAAAVVVTLPDPESSRAIIQIVRHMAPNVPIFARSRYHVHRFELIMAGAQVVIDEEQIMGETLAMELKKNLELESTPPPPPPAPEALYPDAATLFYVSLFSVSGRWTDALKARRRGRAMVS
ncbi:MAG: cation:proton antiporter [Planctomycetota bacterium]|nr:cation:proton antiporter [Planctomycetota bacterium]